MARAHTVQALNELLADRRALHCARFEDTERLLNDAHELEQRIQQMLVQVLAVTMCTR